VRKGDETRQEIIGKAAPIFNQKGYSGAALSDLMRATELCFRRSTVFEISPAPSKRASNEIFQAWAKASTASSCLLSKCR
jgi:hypothetical protein